MEALNRRALIKRAAVIGAAGWTAPLILSSAADAVTAGTPKCIPKLVFGGGGGYKVHNGGNCGAYVNLDIGASGGGPLCPCGSPQGFGQYVNWSLTGGSGAALYFDTGDTTPKLSTGFVGATSIDIYANPLGGPQTPTPLPVGTYTIHACVLVRCCRLFGGVAHAAYNVQEVTFTLNVTAPCNEVGVSVSGPVVVAGSTCSAPASLLRC